MKRISAMRRISQRCCTSTATQARGLLQSAMQKPTPSTSVPMQDGLWPEVCENKSVHMPSIGRGQLNTSREPRQFNFHGGKTALVVIDMQRDYICEGGFSHVTHKMSPLESIVPATANLLQMARDAGLLVVHTLESHDPRKEGDEDFAEGELGQTPHMRIGAEGPMGRLLLRGEYGNGIIDELTPVDGELVVYKPGKGAFHNTPMHRILPAYGITKLIVAGVTTEVSVQTTLREASGLGYQCVMVEDCTDSFSDHFKMATIHSIRAQQGLLGTWTTDLSSVEKGLTCAGLL